MPATREPAYAPEAQGSVPPGPRTLYACRTRAGLGRAAQCRAGVGRLVPRHPGMKSHICGTPDINCDDFIDRKQARFMGLNAKFAYIAMKQARAPTAFAVLHPLPGPCQLRQSDARAGGG